MISRYLTILAVVIVVIIGISFVGYKKKESVRQKTTPAEPVENELAREDMSSTETVALEQKSYKETKIAFISSRDENFEIYVMNADGSEQKRLTNNPANDMNPCWSPFQVSGEKKE